MSNKEEQISIIIPIYKVEKYLRKCVNSVLSQTYRNIEVILVDDGSPDNCGIICDEYAKTDKRVRVIHKSNGGLSSARNAGLDAAKGKYVGFIDSDDWILPQMYESLFAALNKANADLGICGYVYIDESGNPIKQRKTMLEDSVFTRLDAFNKMVGGGNTVCLITAFNKLYKRSLFDSIRFPDGFIHEDEFTIHHIIDRCDRIVSISDILYMYVQRNDSIMSKYTVKRFTDSCAAFYDRYYFFKKKGMNRHARKALRGCYGVVGNGIAKLDFDENKNLIKPLYRKTLYCLVKNFDIRASILFAKYHLFKHQCIYTLIKRFYRTIIPIKEVK